MGDRILEILFSNDFSKLKNAIRNIFGLLQIPVFLILFYYSLLSFEQFFETDFKLIDILRDTENKYLAFFTNPNLLLSYVTESLNIVMIMLAFSVLLSSFGYFMYPPLLMILFFTIGESLFVLKVGLKLYLRLPEFFTITLLVTIVLIVIAIEIINYHNLWENEIARTIIVCIIVVVIPPLLFL